MSEETAARAPLSDRPIDQMMNEVWETFRIMRDVDHRRTVAAAAEKMGLLGAVSFTMEFQKLIRHVLWLYGAAQGVMPDAFTADLLLAIKKASPQQMRRVGESYPAYVALIVYSRNGDREQLAKLAAVL